MSLKRNWSSYTPPCKHYVLTEFGRSLLSYPTAGDFILKCQAGLYCPAGL